MAVVVASSGLRGGSRGLPLGHGSRAYSIVSGHLRQSRQQRAVQVLTGAAALDALLESGNYSMQQQRYADTGTRADASALSPWTVPPSVQSIKRRCKVECCLLHHLTTPLHRLHGQCNRPGRQHSAGDFIRFQLLGWCLVAVAHGLP